MTAIARFLRTNSCRVGKKLLTVFLSISLVSLLLFCYIAFSSLNELGDYSGGTCRALGRQTTNDSVVALEEPGENSVRQKDRDVARQIGTGIKQLSERTGQFDDITMVVLKSMGVEA